MEWRSDFVVSLAAAALALAGAGFALTSALRAEVCRMAAARRQMLDAEDRLWREVARHLAGHDAWLDSLTIWARAVNRRLKAMEGQPSGCGFTLPDDLSFTQDDPSKN